MNSTDIERLCIAYQKVKRFEEQKQISFWFMHPDVDILFRKPEQEQWFAPFAFDNNLRLDFYNKEFVASQIKMRDEKEEADAKNISKMKHQITANERKRKKESK